MQDKETLWKSVLGELELMISKPNFTTWFKDTFVSLVEDDAVVVAVPNTFTQAWLENKYSKSIREALQNVLERDIRQVEFKVETRSSRKLEMPADDMFVVQRTVARPTETEEQSTEYGLNTRYLFENYVVGKNNELAHAAAMASAERPGEVYNPLFIYGGVGLGKTHLVQAIGLSVRAKNPKAKILYASCEKFTNDYITAVKSGKGSEFQNTYRNVDVLLIDDIQFLTGKEGTQEAFFHTFNTLHQSNKQIAITSDRPPKEIAGLEQRLLSRFEWGMIADISNPDLETRIAILEAKCQERGLQLPKEVIDYTAENIQSNIRELEGALNRIVAYQELNRTLPTLENTKNILSAFLSTRKNRSVTPKHILTTVSEFFDVKTDDILGVSRKKELVVPRQIVMFLMRNELKSSFPAIGTELGGRDHTTAMHACSKIEKQLDESDKLKQDVHLIKQKLYDTA